MTGPVNGHPLPVVVTVTFNEGQKAHVGISGASTDETGEVLVDAVQAILQVRKQLQRDQQHILTPSRRVIVG